MSMVGLQCGKPNFMNQPQNDHQWGVTHPKMVALSLSLPYTTLQTPWRSSTSMTWQMVSSAPSWASLADPW